MFQATRAVGHVLGGWPATGSPDGHAGVVRPTGAWAARDLAQRNEASIKAGRITKYSTRLSTPTHHAYT